MTDKKLKVLVCVSGMTPVIITETLYELVTKKKFIPDEIHVITTLVGKKEIENQLLGKNGAIAQFMSMYLPEQTILFGDSTIHIPKDDNGMELEDIATHDHNKIGANTTYTVMRQLKDRKAQIHASIAGGRRTMSFYMGQAFSLVADHDDTLSHVLVSSPFEMVSDFYFPSWPEKNHNYKEEDRKTGFSVDKSVCSSTAKISLAEVAVLKLGAIWGGNFPEKARSDLAFAMKLVQAMYEPPKLIIKEDKNKFKISVLGVEIKLEPQQLIIFIVFAYFLEKFGNEDGVVVDVSCFSNIGKDIIDQNYNSYSPLREGKLNAIDGWQYGSPKIKSINSAIKKIFIENIGPASKWFVFDKLMKGCKEDHKYFFPLPRSAIETQLGFETEEIISKLNHQ